MAGIVRSYQIHIAERSLVMNEKLEREVFENAGEGILLSTPFLPPFS
jgi:hypothetical protein